jgi:chemotaxis protein methyltransferase CheR
MAETELDLLLSAIFSKYKYDFRQYSRASVLRRMQTALTQFDIASLSGLQEKVLHEDGFFLKLLQFLTIPVTELFRDPNYFAAFRNHVVPHLKTYASFKIWIAGCSTGEEVYSFAILLHEEGILERALIYATDINPVSLEHAQTGIYRGDGMARASQNYLLAGGTRSLSDYYEEGYGSFKILPFLKPHLLFTDHSLATDSVFSEVHFVSCRNVLIYFERELQERAVQLFSDSLILGGFLGIGEKENLKFMPQIRNFDPAVPENRIYRKKMMTF